ncbi:DNA repair protein [Deinococcus yavapaiensis]|uniref:Uncharacterized protein n=1 Tax=Deinococcus yavapaiensis KR-236 TaxID=694435 RepID=A0A318S4U3_9DEIO|nr:DNA repair protein [Deinococcus yavapaiensis]PYE52713.1 hypothetical protein DES52_11234 [Deinococcus yavapaiensis KR-236]
MTKAARKTDTPTAPDTATFETFDALMATAAVDSVIAPLARDGADGVTLNRELSAALAVAHDRWGLGLLHLRHEAHLVQGGDRADIALLVDGREAARVSAGSAAIRASYEAMRATDENDLSAWGVLPDGHRAVIKNSAQVRVLIEDARDFETHWTTERSGAYSRVWRSGDTLGVEVHRPASPSTALSDAAWDAIASIKNRTLQRELMQRSNTVGMLGALLGARHKNAAAALEHLPEAHFTIRSVVVRATGSEGRDFERYKALVKEATAQLEDLQAAGTRHLGQLLALGLK